MTNVPDVAEGFELVSFERAPDPVDLFLYSASVWLPHRIHYDVPYTTGIEGHPGLLIQGPLQGVYLMQVVTATFGSDVDVTRFTFRHQVPVYVDQRLRCAGRVTAVDAAAGAIICELWTELDDGRRATVAEAHLAMSPREPYDAGST